ncbi:MAG: nucleoside kinase [Lachnospiraceae bacterium]|jgi:uridine kinase|nr:nucleoside kinase [Lachnospiraceae bacterium]
MVNVNINDKVYTYPQGTSYKQIAADFQVEHQHEIVLAVIGNKMKELNRSLEEDCSLSFITLGDNIGNKVYARSATMLLFAAIDKVLGREVEEKFQLAFTIGQGHYCHLNDEYQLTDDDVAKIKAEMNEIVERDLPFAKTIYPLDEAIHLFRERGMGAKEKLFRYRRSQTVNVYSLGEYMDYYYGYMLPSTGYLRYFDIIHYHKGIMLLLPEVNDPCYIAPFNSREKLFNTLLRSEEWGKKMGIGTVGDLNDAISAGEINEMILVQEAFMEHRIAEIAEVIALRDNVKLVTIAGPTSSGKTTFSHRLSIQLRTHGLSPQVIGLDDYYLNRDQIKRDEKGELDFESLEAIDVALFNEDMGRLLAGETVELPKYNFITGSREYKGYTKRLGADDILIIEGIHGLNPQISHTLPGESIFKVYISCLTGLNIDSHNRIPTTDSRLLRRIVRDNRTRGTKAGGTIKMWASVRRGEEAYIFPYQEEADAMFNSAMIYELAILKQYAEPLLFQIGKDEPGYFEAKRLLKFLEYFIGISSEIVPNTSICREFIGGSIFHA